MKVYLFAVLLMMDGSVVQGGDAPGWAPRIQPDMATCEQRADRASFFAPPSGVAQVWFYCRRIRHGE